MDVHVRIVIHDESSDPLCLSCLLWFVDFDDYDQSSSRSTLKIYIEVFAPVEPVQQQQQMNKWIHAIFNSVGLSSSSGDAVQCLLM